MPFSIRRIVRRHHTSLRGNLHFRRKNSNALGTRKGYYVYEPHGLEREHSVPVLYLFRGHEREWVNMKEDGSRKKSTAIEDIDGLIEKSLLPPMLVVMPGLNSTNNHIPSLGINMAGDVSPRTGLGTGRFWDYLRDELIPDVEGEFPAIQGERRLMAGFSLGGYTVANLGVRAPGLFHEAAIYDGLFMWPNHDDPREDEEGAFSDPVWSESGIFDAAFGNPRDREAMLHWNPTNHLMRAELDTLNQIRETTFWIACASTDGDTGNRDRAQFFVDLLREKDIPLGFSNSDIILDPDASHSWHWTDRFLTAFLRNAYAKNATAT